MRLSSLTVDEQLNGFRGYVPGRSYMPAKPAKYGVKISWLNDAKNGFALDCYIYSGKGETREVGIAETIVMRLTKGYFNTNRDTQVSIWIGTLHHAAWSSSSYKMASQQLAQFLSIVATSHTNSKSQREGPNTIQKLCMSQAIVWWWFLTFRRGINRLSSFLQLTRHQQRVDKKPEMVLHWMRLSSDWTTTLVKVALTSWIAELRIFRANVDFLWFSFSTWLTCHCWTLS